MANEPISGLPTAPAVNSDAYLVISQLNGVVETSYKSGLDLFAVAMESRLTVPTYVKTWNASTNTPTLSSGAATAGTIYTVGTAGTTTLDGISSWAIGDLAYNNGTTWSKILAVGQVPEFVKTWDAATNTPTLASGPATAGTIYTVGTAGSTILDGISSWEVGDLAYNNGTIWSKVVATGGVPEFVKTWNANTNTPTLSSGAAAAGTLYAVGTAGTTTLDGVSSWAVGDYAYNNGTIWSKIEAKGTVPEFVLTWNANTNSPTLSSGAATAGTLYAVGTAGTTTLDGVSSWAVGDYAYNNGTIWSKVEAKGTAPEFVLTWNANTNTPTLASGAAPAGSFYAVSTPGTTTLDGISDWDVGDFAYNNGSTWTRIRANQETGTHSTTWGGAIPATAGNISYSINGNVVTLQFTTVNEFTTSSATISATTPLPANLRPANSLIQPAMVINTDQITIGQVNILAGDGSIIFSTGVDGDLYPNGFPCGISTFSISYITA